MYIYIYVCMHMYICISISSNTTRHLLLSVAAGRHNPIWILRQASKPATHGNCERRQGMPKRGHGKQEDDHT